MHPYHNNNKNKNKNKNKEEIVIYIVFLFFHYIRRNGRQRLIIYNKELIIIMNQQEAITTYNLILDYIDLYITTGENQYSHAIENLMQAHPDICYPNTLYTPFSYVVRKTFHNQHTTNTNTTIHVEQQKYRILALLPFLITSYIDASYRDMCLLFAIDSRQYLCAQELLQTYGARFRSHDLLRWLDSPDTLDLNHISCILEICSPSSYGLDPHAKTANHNTALHVYCSLVRDYYQSHVKPSVEFAQALVNFGIDPAAKNMDNETAATVLMKPHHPHPHNHNHNHNPDIHQTFKIISSYASEFQKLYTYLSQIIR